MAISALLLLTMLPIGMAQGTTLRVYPTTKTVYVNQSFTIDINVTDVTDLYSFQLNITWDKGVLNLTSDNIHPPSVWGSDWFVWPQTMEERINNTLGLYTIMVTALDPAPPFNGSASLVTFTYKAINTGTTTIGFIYETVLGNSTADEIPHMTIDGTVTVSTPPVGGVWVPVDKLALLAPYIALASTILVATVATAIYVKRVKFRKEKN